MLLVAFCNFHQAKNASGFSVISCLTASLFQHNDRYIESGGIRYYVKDENLTVTKKIKGKYSGNIQIPAQVILNKEVFAVTMIDDSAFKNATELINVTISETVETISRDAFNGATNLVNISVDPENNAYHSYDGVLYDNNSNDIFKVPEGITSVKLYRDIAVLPEGVFNDCKKLTSLTLAASTRLVTSRAASDLPNLTEIIVDENNEFYASHDGILYSKNLDTLKLCPRGKSAVSIYPKTKIIGLAAFENCIKLTTIQIPNSVTEIMAYAFQSCIALKSVNISPKITKIADATFFACVALENLEIPDSVTEFGNVIFQHCRKLHTVHIPAAVKSIYRNPFADCKMLTGITVDSNNENYAAIDGILYSKNADTLISYPCGSLRKSFRIPNGVKVIREWSFYFNKNLESVTIPNSVTAIEWYVFFDTKNLKSIICESTSPPKLAINTEKPSGKITVFVPKQNVASYKNAAMWRLYKIKPSTIE